MNKLKYLSVVFFAALWAGVFIFSCKNDKDDPATTAKEEGIKAGEAMCACVASYEAPDPATWTGTPEALQQAFEAYYGQLYSCLGVIHPYEKYARLKLPDETAQTTDPLLAVFVFHDNNFKDGFQEGVGSCYEAFNALWDLIPQ